MLSGAVIVIHSHTFLVMSGSRMSDIVERWQLGWYLRKLLQWKMLSAAWILMRARNVFATGGTKVQAYVGTRDHEQFVRYRTRQPIRW